MRNHVCVFRSSLPTTASSCCFKMWAERRRFFWNVSEFTIGNVSEETVLGLCEAAPFSHTAPCLLYLRTAHFTSRFYFLLAELLLHANQHRLLPRQGFSFFSSVQASLHCLTDSSSSSFEITRLIFHLIVYLKQISLRVSMDVAHVTQCFCLNFSEWECMLKCLGFHISFSSKRLYSSV